MADNQLGSLMGGMKDNFKKMADKIANSPEVLAVKAALGRATLRVAGVVEESVVDGVGVRMAIFAQGCELQCEGCHNPQTFDKKGGKEVKLKDLAEQLSKNYLVGGVSFSGGEPFLQPAPFALFANYAHALGMTVWCYSGYTLEELREKAQTDEAVNRLLNIIDVLVDGRYEKDKKNTTEKFKGSSNQRIIDLAKMRKEKSDKIIQIAFVKKS